MFPNELKKLNNWVGYIRATKCPMDAKTGKAASSSDKLTWSSYEEAKKACSKYGWDGLGFCFEAPWVGIDLDDCVVNGKLNDFAREVMSKTRSYTEYSPSGTGIHIIAKGNLPSAIKETHIEAYQSGRYFTVTERTLQPQLPIRQIDCSFLEGYRTSQRNKFSPSIVAASIKEGNRDNSLMSLASSLWQRGYSKEDMYSLLEPKAKEVDYVQHLPRIIESASRYPRNIKTPELASTPVPEVSLSATEFMSVKEESGWIVKDLIGNAAIHFIAGLNGTLKTWACVDLALECQKKDGMWLSAFPVKRSKVIYIDQERSRSQLQKRISKLMKQKGLSISDLEGGFMPINGTEYRIDIPDHFNSIRNLIMKSKADLVIVDSFATFHTKNENLRNEIQPVLERLKSLRNEFRCSFIFIHHENGTAYTSEKEGIKPNTGQMSGSEAIPAACEVVITVRANSDDSSFFYSTKNNISHKLPPFLVTIEDTDKEETMTKLTAHIEDNI